MKKSIINILVGGILAGGMALADETVNLEGVRQKVLKNNYNIIAQKLGWEAGLEQQQAEQAIFDPELVLGISKSRNESFNTQKEQQQFVLQGSQVSKSIDADISFDFGLEQTLASGAQVRLGSNVQDHKDNFNDYDSEFQSFTGLSVTQPLLKGRGKEVSMAKIRIAAAESGLAKYQYQQMVIKTMSAAEAAYWDLYLSQEECKIWEKSIEKALEVLKDNQERVAAGKMREIEVAQAESGVELRKANLDQAQQRKMLATDQLYSLLGSYPDAENRNLSATDKPVITPITVDFKEDMKMALAKHPDYLIRKIYIDREDIRVAYANNQSWPQLDLKASYGMNGYGESYSDMVESMDGEWESWSVGLVFTMPIGGKKSRHEYIAAQKRKQQALQAFKSTEITIANTLHAAISQSKVMKKQVDSYTKIVEFNNELLKEELNLFAEGKSDSRRVLEVEEDLLEANRSLLESKVKFQKSLIDLDVSRGTYLESRHIEVEEISTQ